MATDIVAKKTSKSPIKYVIISLEKKAESYKKYN